MNKTNKIIITTFTILVLAIPLFAARGRGGRGRSFGGGGRGRSVGMRGGRSFGGGRGFAARGPRGARAVGFRGRGGAFVAARGARGRGFVAARGPRGGRFVAKGRWGRGRGQWGRGRYGRWGRGWYGRRRWWGPGWRWRGSWWGTPWWSWGYYRPDWWVGAWPPVYVENIETTDRAIDEAGYRYWKVYNSTPLTLTFYTDDGLKTTIAPGDEADIYRGRSFVFAIGSSDGTPVNDGSSAKHFIKIFLDTTGKIKWMSGR